MDTRSQLWALSRGKERVVLSWRSSFRRFGLQLQGGRCEGWCTHSNRNRWEWNYCKKNDDLITDMMYMGKEGRTKIILKFWVQVIDNMGPLISEVASGGGSKLSGVRQSWGEQFCAFEFDLLHSSRWWCSVVRSEQSWEVRLWDTEAKGAQRLATELKLLRFRHWMGLSVFYNGICKLSFNSYLLFTYF